MQDITGKYNTAKVFCDTADSVTLSQIREMCNQRITEGLPIRIMPDTHAGAGCTVGTTMGIGDYVVPNWVGVDEGCGMLVINLGVLKINLPELDKFIRKNIPSGFNNNIKNVAVLPEIDDLYCLKSLKKTDYNLALGSLGGGNHFIEIDINAKGEYLLVIHSGSRNLGKQMADYYQNRAESQLREIYDRKAKYVIANNIGEDIEVELCKLREVYSVPKPMAYLSEGLKDEYMHDLDIVQKYASLNRKTMAKRIVEYLDLNYKHLETFETIHNYIDMKRQILRKGAVSAETDEVLIIPINMRDGCLICKGKGNEDWNYSAPHGAGRILGRNEAKKKLSMMEFEKSMDGIYSSSVSINTLDECPQAYKPIEEIIANVKDTVDIIEVVKPIYNFKAGEE